MVIVPFVKEDIKDYLDKAIRKWRSRKFKAVEGEAGDLVMMTECYIDAFQSIRMSLFGELLDEDKEEE